MQPLLKNERYHGKKKCFADLNGVFENLPGNYCMYWLTTTPPHNLPLIKFISIPEFRMFAANV